MEFSTYILFGGPTQKYYTGQTEDLARRLEEHNRGKDASTKYGVPWKIVYSQSFKTRAEAMALKKKIKKARGSKVPRQPEPGSWLTYHA